MEVAISRLKMPWHLSLCQSVDIHDTTCANLRRWHALFALVYNHLAATGALACGCARMKKIKGLTFCQSLHAYIGISLQLCLLDGTHRANAGASAAICTKVRVDRVDVAC